MEKDRGISVSASAMSFDFKTLPLQSGGHARPLDFSEDTYRTLTAVDAAVMVIDGAKGVESQTQKLFEVCRLRDLPILTFCNKMDRESRDTLRSLTKSKKTLRLTSPRHLAHRRGPRFHAAATTCCATGWN